jgi:hypothetical protein
MKPAELKVERRLAPNEAPLLPPALQEPLRRNRTPRRLSWRLVLTLGIAVLLITAAGAYGR